MCKLSNKVSEEVKRSVSSDLSKKKVSEVVGSCEGVSQVSSKQVSEVLSQVSSKQVSEELSQVSSKQVSEVLSNESSQLSKNQSVREVVSKVCEVPSKEVCEVVSNEEVFNKNQVAVRSSAEFVELFEMVHSSGQPNYVGCKVKVGTQFNMEMWRRRLQDYEDKVVCEFIEYGFPLDVDSEKELCFDVRKNHKGARDHPDFIRKYFERERSVSRVAGPFTKNPLSIPLVVSPMNTVPKRNSVDERRVIVDLSWPVGAAVNEGISKDYYLGELIDLHYASVEEICRMVIEMGSGSVIYKRDLRHAYRQIPVDPRDYRYLGYYWDDEFYIDLVLAMGQRNAAMACTRVTQVRCTEPFGLAA